MEPDDETGGQPQAGLPPPVIPDHQLLRCIGRGSYGAVWLARNSLGLYRAVKVVYRKSFSESRPFEREWSGICKFEPISRLHEGFVDILHVGINETEGYFFYVMELGDDQESGQSIEPTSYCPKTLDRQIASHGRFTAQECIQLGLALSQALAHLHEQGLVHRDIKPPNIIFVNGTPKLADIGLVAELHEARSFVGTEGFIPPEGPGTPQADVYGLGKVLYEASTGRDRHDFPDLPILLEQSDEGDKFLELNEVILRACRHQTGERYASASDMHADLVLVADGKSLRRQHLLEQRYARFKRIAGACLLAAAILGTAIYAVYRQQKGAFEARQRTAGASIADGIQAMDSGDYLGSLPRFSEALRVDPGGMQNEFAQRLRIGSILDQCPKLTQVWVDKAPATDGQFSPDGTRVLLTRYFADAQVYDLRDGALCDAALKAPPTLISGAYSPDGRLLVTVSQTSVACIWDAADFREIRRLPHLNSLWSARFSPDGQRLVTAASDGVARVWDIKTGQMTLALKQHTNDVHFADFSHDGKLIVTASHDTSARLWNASNGQLVSGPLTHGAWVTYAAFSPDDQKLVTACLDRKARVWDTGTGRRILPDLNHADGVQSAEFSPDGRLILTASSDGTARLWQADTLQPMAANSILRHGSGLSRAAFSPDGHRILTTCADGSARIWDLAGSAATHVVITRPLSSDGNRCLVDSTNDVQVRDTVTGRDIGPKLVSRPLLDRVVMSCDGHFLLTVSEAVSGTKNRLVQVWDVATGRPVGPGLVLSNAPTGLWLAERSQRLLIEDGGHVRIWDTATGQTLSPLLPYKSPADRSLLSHDGHLAVTISGHEIRVWDAVSGRAIFAPITCPQPVQDVQFSQDDQYLAACSGDNLLAAGYAQVFSATTGHPVGVRLSHGAGILSVAFSPDSRRVVTASADFSAVVWDVVTGRQLAPALKHENQVRCAVFSPDNRWVVTACADQTARVWDPRTGQPLTPPLRGLSPLNRAGFLADQRHIFTVDNHAGAQIWTLSVDQRPVSDLLSLTQMLSGGSAGNSAESANQAADLLESVWRRLRTQYPNDFTISPAEVVAWHGLQAQESEAQGQWFAAVFHLERLKSLRPDDASLEKRLAQAKEQLRNVGR